MQTIRETLQALIAERDRLNGAIEALEAALGALQGISTRGRGRRPAAEAERKKPNWSPAAKEAARKRMKKYWADRKKAESGAQKKAPLKKAAATRSTKKKATSRSKPSKKAPAKTAPKTATAAPAASETPPAAS